MVHTLASKVLHTPLFTAMEWSSPEFQPTKVFHLADRILERKTSSSSLTVAEAITNIPTSEDPEEVAKRQARLVVETIASFDAHTLDDRGPITSYDSRESTGAIYPSDVATRLARERRSIQPNIVRMMNDIDILVVSRTGTIPLGLLFVN